QWTCVTPPNIASLCCDKWGNLYIEGSFNKYYSPFTVGKYTFTTKNEDAILMKYNSSGKLIWAESTHSASAVSGVSFYTLLYNYICADDSGNIIITGGIGDTVNFG